MTVERLPVSPETVTVLGNRVKKSSPAWRGLDLENADLATQATIMLVICGPDEAPPDLHLRVPWWHPDDGPAPSPPEMYYRVRPRMEPGKKWKGKKVESVAFERWRGEWMRPACGWRAARKVGCERVERPFARVGMDARCS